MSNYNNDDSFQIGQRGNKNDFSTREFLLKYIYLIPWIVVSVSIATAIAYTRLRYINPIYSASGKVLIKQDRPSGLNSGTGGGNQLIGDVVATSVNSRSMDDQMELVKSTAMARMVVRNAALQQSYYYKGSMRNTLVHVSASPVQLNILSVADSSNGLSLSVKVLGKETFIVNENPAPIRFGALFQIPAGSFVLEKKFAEIASNTEFICNWTPEEPLARSLAGSINVGVATKGGNVLNFAYSSENYFVAQDVVNGFLKAYQDYSLQDKREGSLSALNFIDDQLAQVKGDLTNVEGNLQQFREDAEYWRKCKKLISKLQFKVDIESYIDLPHPKIKPLLEKANLFVLPTEGENFGHAIFEALAVGCPVLISDQTPWRKLKAKKAGMDLPLSDLSGFTTAIQSFVDMGDAEWQEYRNGALTLAQDYENNLEALAQYNQLFENAE